MRYLFIRYHNGLKTFHIDIKTIERVKRQTMFQTKMAHFKVNNPKLIRIENVQFIRFCFYIRICIGQFPHLY